MVGFTTVGVRVFSHRLGNVTNDGAHPYTFDAENRLITAGGVTYTRVE
jgi:hypothetical protein